MSEQAAEITVERLTGDDDHVAVVEVHRPPNNFFDVGMIAGIATALEDLAADGTTRAVVLCTEGKHFCAGANFGGGSRAPEAGAAPERHLYDEAIRLFEQPLPVVAAVQGSAIGGGLGLALAADFRVATPSTRMAANFALLGFHHGFALTVTLPRLAGEQAALDLLLTGRRVGGEEALRLGLVDRLVGDGEERTAATSLAREIAAAAPLATRSIRATMRVGFVEAARSAMAHERAEQDRLSRTDDWREGVAAVAARRPGRFTGR